MEDRVIMLVEDNPDEVELTLRTFEEERIRNKVLVFNDGAEANDYLFGKGASAGPVIDILPALIILDLNLPKINGIELLRRIRADERTRLCPVIILTSTNEDHDRITSYKLGANSYIRKPVDSKQFSESMKILRLYWLLINEPPLKPGRV